MAVVNEGEAGLPVLTVQDSWEDLIRPGAKALEGLLPSYLLHRRWFGGKARTIQCARIAEAIPVPQDPPRAFLTLIQVDYADGGSEVYRLPVTCVPADEARQLKGAQGAIARVVAKGDGGAVEGVLYDAMWVESFLVSFLDVLARGVRYSGPFGQIIATPTKVFAQLLRSGEGPLEPSVMKAEQSNTSVVYGGRFILKLYRRGEQGINPDLEIGRFLTEREFPSIAAVASALEHHPQGGVPATVALLQQFRANQGDAWGHALESLGRYLPRALAQHERIAAESASARPWRELAAESVPALAHELIGSFLEQVALLGVRTGELHVALSGEEVDPNFAPEPLTDASRRALCQTIDELITRNFALLRQRLDVVPSALQARAREALGVETQVTGWVKSLRDRPLTCMLIRCHGDYHLGQVLYTGQDFIIIDFEGEPARPLRVRRMKGSPLRDVAGMLRSFHYAAHAAAMRAASGPEPQDPERVGAAVRFWYQWVAATYAQAYFKVTRSMPFLPASTHDLDELLDAFLIEKAVYELGYELNNRPDWIRIPLEGILELATSGRGDRSRRPGA